ncbi:MAG: DUF4292 domain-containing protein [Chitinophagales bacterium]|nr:DUF4292 domain-containing protein [Chitinophagales bacterium]
MKNSFKLLLLLIVLISSCRSAKESTEAIKVRKISPKTLSGKIEKKELHYEWYSSKIKLDYSDSKLSQAFTANVRMKKDSIIWLSLTGFLGLEGGRVLITQDSVKIIDRLNKEFLEYPITYLSRYFPMQTSITEMQNILSGTNLLRGREIAKVDVDSYQYQVLVFEKLIDIDFWIHPKNYTYNEMRLKHKFENQQLIYKFGNYKTVNKHLLSHSRKIEIENGNQQIFIDMEISKIELDKKLSFPFEVPARYKKTG